MLLGPTSVLVMLGFLHRSVSLAKANRKSGVLTSGFGTVPLLFRS
jgi:hypothetical protein